ncbi:MAG: hypothetical protein Kow0059_17460 [Candidatus Sumerlaeia bacterium]
MRLFIVQRVVLTLLAAFCSTVAGAIEVTASSSTQAAAPAATPVGEAAGTESIWSHLEKDGSYQMMLRLFRAAGYEALLKEEKPHTVFVVKDADLTKHISARREQDMIKPENLPKLKELMGYHIAREAFNMGQFLEEPRRLTITDKPVFFKETKEDLVLNENRPILDSFAVGQSFVIVIGNLLRPEDAETLDQQWQKAQAELAARAARGPQPTVTPRPTPAPRSIYGELKSLDNLSQLAQAIEAAGLDQTLQKKGPYTVFAPVNEAFQALPAGEMEQLLKPENREKLQAILKYHVVDGIVRIGGLTEKTTATTMQGAELMIDPESGTVGGAHFLEYDAQVDNGLIHFIDAVLIPPKQ